jgi:hypothetical protein
VERPDRADSIAFNNFTGPPDFSGIAIQTVVLEIARSRLLELGLIAAIFTGSRAHFIEILLLPFIILIL